MTSNMVSSLNDKGYYYNMNYTKYDEVIDVNRWRKSDNYYMYRNGVLNRSIYYNEGGVGIGTTNVKATLDVSTINSSMYSIKTNNSIWINNNVVASSDERIKTNIVDIDDGNALNKLLKIEPKIYDYVDDRKIGGVYGFIAQQVGEVLPEAVKREREFIPNVYSKCYVVDDIIVFEDVGIDIYNKVAIGDVIRIVLEGSNADVSVVKIVNNNTLVIDRVIEGCDKAFVYGKQVDDFCILDKNAVYTLNVCATQDLYRCVQKQKEVIDARDEVIRVLQERVDNVI